MSRPDKPSATGGANAAVALRFQRFASSLTVNNRPLITRRRESIVRRLNGDFWEASSAGAHYFYVGSYGRDTAIRSFHDVDLLFQLPQALRARYDAHAGNGQSALLQAVRGSLLRTFPQTKIGGDGQVVVVRFRDEMRFEVLPAFKNPDGAYAHPDSNGGGTWRVTNPKPEIEAVSALDAACNSNLKRLCRLARAWRRTWSVPISGWLLDALIVSFLKTHRYRAKPHSHYARLCCDLFNFLSQQGERQYWLAPGSRQRVPRDGAFEFKAKRCHLLAIKALKHEIAGDCKAAVYCWKQVFGREF